jgi:hypothetical protein
MYGSTNEFKNLLVQNRWKLYQEALITSISHPSTFSASRYSNKTIKNKRYFHCDHHHCMYTSMQYIKLNYVTYDMVNCPSDVTKLDKIKIKEHLWYNEKNKDTYQITLNPLTLNNIPIEFIYKRKKIVKDTVCYSIHFKFDLSIYCNMIVYVLKSLKYKHLLFNYLPKEIVHYILYLTSIIL